MSSISQFSYTSLPTELTSLFDFDNFLDNSQLITVLGYGNTSGGVVNTNVQSYISSLLTVYTATAQQDAKSFVDDFFQNALADWTITNCVAPAIASQSGNVLSTTNTSQMGYLSGQIYAIIGSP